MASFPPADRAARGATLTLRGELFHVPPRAVSHHFKLVKLALISCCVLIYVVVLSFSLSSLSCCCRCHILQSVSN